MTSTEIEHAAFNAFQDLRMAGGASVTDIFKKGAEWQRNGVWHTANEQPDPNRLLCVCCADFRDKIIVIDEYKPKEQRFYYEDGENYDYISLEHEGLRWAYIEDLLPEQIIKQK